MRTRAAGLILFLPVPLVLALFTRAPLGIHTSLGIGVLLMLTHRLYARPWALARAPSRCLWCGAELPRHAGSAFPELAVEDPLGRVAWRACGGAHAGRVRAVIAWAAERRRFLAPGILGTLGVFLLWAAASAFGAPQRPAFDDAVAFFRLGIAFSVLPLGWLAAGANPPPGRPLRAPFPLHLPALIGLQWVLWLFRLIGLLWLAQGLFHVAGPARFIG